MALIVLIAGINQTSKVVVNSMRLDLGLNARSRLSFRIVILPGESASTEVGAQVDLNDGVTDLFGGFIDSVTESVAIEGNTATLTREIECVSFDAIADRRLVAKSYETAGQTMKTIILDIVSTFLSGESLTTTNVDTGPVVEPIKWNYEPASKAFDDLANLSGFAWWVDEGRNLYFKPRSGVAAPISITASNARNVTVSKTAETYRNRQLIRAGTELTNNRTENFTGDGTRKAFTLSYPVGEAPSSITVAGTPKTFGIRGVDTGKDWYYQLGEAVVSQDDAAAAVASATAIAITYKGQYPIIVQSQDDVQITGQASLGGGSGIWESIDTRPNLNDTTSAQNIAQGLLRRYGRIPRRITFETNDLGLKSGQIVTVSFPQHNVSGGWLIDNVQARDRNGQQMIWTVEAIDGESLGGWHTFFDGLMAVQNRIEFRENEVVVLLRAQSEQVSLTDSFSFTTGGAVSTVGSAVVGYSEVGV